MKLNRRIFCLAALVAALPGANAQTYPARPVTIVVPQAPGGTNDALGRILAQKLTEAKAHKPVYQYASAGNGSLNHLLGEMLNKGAGLELGHVPYKGVSPALTDVIGGQIPMAFASLPSCIGHLRSGKLRALA